MPYTKTRCGCNICRGKCDLVNKRTAKLHLEKYGRFEDHELTSSPCTSPIKRTTWPQMHTDKNQVHVSSSRFEHQEEGDGCLPEYEGECLISSDINSDDVCIDACSSSGSWSMSLESDCEDPELLDDSVVFEIEDEIECSVDVHSLFGFDYNEDLYRTGIAVKKAPNSDFTILQWLALNFLLFTSHPSISKETFTDNLKMQKRFQRDPDNLLPSTYYEARKLITPFLAKKIKYDVCINDCIIYKNNEELKYGDLQQCPKCSEDRFIMRKSGRVARTFVYIPIGPRLARIYGESNLAKLVQCHPGDEFEGTDMYDIHQSPAWKSLYSTNGYFAGNKMGVSLALELDGVNPFHNIGVQYSMIPIMVTILNFPRQIRNSFGNIQLLGIIPSATGNSRCQYQQDAYIDIFVDELLTLTECKAYSAYHSAPIEVKIKLLLYILDYPGLCKLFHQHESGSISGCHWCEVQGERCTHLDKVIYLSNRSSWKMTMTYEMTFLIFQRK